MRLRLRTAGWLVLFGSTLVIPDSSLASAQQIVLGRVSKIEPSAISLDQPFAIGPLDRKPPSNRSGTAAFS